MTKEEQFIAFWSSYPRPSSPPKNPCSVHGCGREVAHIGYCKSHYHKFKRYGDPLGGAERAQGEIVRWLQDAWRSVTGDCIIWPFPDDGSGYAIFSFGGKPQRAHRFACEMFNGAAPSSKHHAAHECGNSLCVNRRHISWKTPIENMADKVRHGTNLTGEKHHQAKLTAEDVTEIRSLRHVMTRATLASMFGVGLSTIDNILDGVTWRDVE